MKTKQKKWWLVTVLVLHHRQSYLCKNIGMSRNFYLVSLATMFVCFMSFKRKGIPVLAYCLQSNKRAKATANPVSRVTRAELLCQALPETLMCWKKSKPGVCELLWSPVSPEEALPSDRDRETHSHVNLHMYLLTWHHLQGSKHAAASQPTHACLALL